MRPTRGRRGACQVYFNPRTPCGVRRVSDIIDAFGLLFQSTHPLRGATYYKRVSIWQEIISIHAPLAGCDCDIMANILTRTDFNPRTPCGVRLERHARWDARTNFNPRTPCGVRRQQNCWVDITCKISIHAPLAGCDYRGLRLSTCELDFNPRTPCGVRHCHHILAAPVTYFNPRTPCGVRLFVGADDPVRPQFQSTHPLRGATRPKVHPLRHTTISIHAPLAGCDCYDL